MALTVALALLGALLVGGGCWLATRPILGRPVHLSHELLAAASEVASKERRTVEEQIELWAWTGRSAARDAGDRGDDCGSTGGG